METLDHKISTLDNQDMVPKGFREAQLVKYWHDKVHRVLTNKDEKLSTKIMELEFHIQGLREIIDEMLDSDENVREYREARQCLKEIEQNESDE